MIKVITKLNGVFVLIPDLHTDNRGWFMETWSKNNLEDQGIFIDFVQDNHSYTKHKNTLRGIHYQIEPMAQTKLVRVIKGSVFDVVIDLRKESETFHQWFGIELSAENKNQLFIPKGFGHGFITLSEDVEFAYKCDNYYSKQHERGIKYDDPTIAIDWPCGMPIVSEKDYNLPYLINNKKKKK